MQYYFEKYGRSVRLLDTKGWQSPLFRAFLQPLRYKNKMYLEGNFTVLGKDPNAVYLYIGPASHDITRLEDGSVVQDAENQKYIIQHAERVYRGEKPYYCWGIVKKIIEVDLH